MDKLFSLLVVVAIAFLAFVGGAFVVLTKTFPYNYFNNAYQAMDALYHQREDYQTPYQTNLWRPARNEQRGVTVYKSGKVHDGFTLYSSSDAQRAMLIDMNGKVVHECLPIQEIWDDPDRQLRPDGYIFWEYVHMYSNGDLIALVVGMGDTLGATGW